jgi:ureidoacrylate peracid hydrolase
LILATVSEQVQPGHTAVLVIDVQRDFCAEDGVMSRVFGLDLKRVRAAVPPLNGVILGARRAGVPVVWVREVFSPSRMLDNHKLIHGDEGSLQLIREGSGGVDWYSGVIPPDADEPVVTKWNYDAFEGPELRAWLDVRGIRTVVLGGFTTNVCVETTGRHAYLLGYYVVTLADCTGAPDPAEHEAALRNLGRYFGSVVTSDVVLAQWDAARKPDPGPPPAGYG